MTDVVEIIDVQQPENKIEYLVIEEDSIAMDESFELPNILFDFNSDRLLPVSYASLNQLTNYLIQNRQHKISITGHTDDQGNDLFNLGLSERRAKSVFEYLREKGVSANRMNYSGKGEREPLEDNKTEEGREKNRRVEFRLLFIP